MGQCPAIDLPMVVMMWILVGLMAAAAVAAAVSFYQLIVHKPFSYRDEFKKKE